MYPSKSRKAQLIHQYSVLRQTKSCSQTHRRGWLHLVWHLPSVSFQLKFSLLGLNQIQLHCSCEAYPSMKNSKASWQTPAAWAVLAQLLCWPRSNAQTSGCLWDLCLSHAFLQESQNTPGIEFMFLADGAVLWLGFSMRATWLTHWCFGCCSVVLAINKALFSVSLLCSEKVHKKVPQLGQLNWIGQRAIPSLRMSWSV